MTERQKPPFGQPPYVTRVRWRSPEWKPHTSLGRARQAMSYHRGSRELWEWRDEDWHLVEERNGR